MLSQEDRERFNADLKLVRQILQENREKGIRKYAMFLDFDGVIHVFYVQGTPQYEAAMKRMKTKLDFIDPQCLANVDRLTGEFDMDVIISSSWRYNGLDYCRKYLQKSGMKHVDHVVDTTQDEQFLDRRIEIAEYLISHPIYSGFIVLDDIQMKEFEGSYIRINPTVGFDDEKYALAKRILERTDRKVRKNEIQIIA